MTGDEKSKLVKQGNKHLTLCPLLRPQASGLRCGDNAQVHPVDLSPVHGMSLQKQDGSGGVKHKATSIRSHWESFVDSYST